MALNPLKRAFLRGVELGEARARRQAVEHLREQACVHFDTPSAAKKRSALHAAADDIEAGRGVRRG